MSPTCPLCGHDIVYELRPFVSEYKGFKYVYAAHGGYCDSCDESFFSKEDLAKTKDKRDFLKNQIDKEVKE